MPQNEAVDLVRTRRGRRCGFQPGAMIHRARFLSVMPLLLVGLFAGSVTQAVAAGVAITGHLANFDVRYPNSLPNDLEIVLYGDGLKTNSVFGTWSKSLSGFGPTPVGRVLAVTLACPSTTGGRRATDLNLQADLWCGRAANHFGLCGRSSGSVQLAKASVAPAPSRCNRFRL